jgi:hypothetical protein
MEPGLSAFGGSGLSGRSERPSPGRTLGMSGWRGGSRFGFSDFVGSDFVGSDFVGSDFVGFSTGSSPWAAHAIEPATNTKHVQSENTNHFIAILLTESLTTTAWITGA